MKEPALGSSTVDRRTFLRRVQEDPSLAFSILRSLSERVRRLDNELSKLRTAADAPQRGAS